MRLLTLAVILCLCGSLAQAESIQSVTSEGWRKFISPPETDPLTNLTFGVVEGDSEHPKGVLVQVTARKKPKTPKNGGYIEGQTYCLRAPEYWQQPYCVVVATKTVNGEKPSKKEVPATPEPYVPEK